MEIPFNATKIIVDGSSVDFYTFQHDDVTYFAFDTSRCTPPEPMVNALRGLKFVDAPNKRLLMINHKMPIGLLDRIKEKFVTVSHVREDGLVEVVFGLRETMNVFNYSN